MMQLLLVVAVLSVPLSLFWGTLGVPGNRLGLISRRHVTIGGWHACVRNVARVAETLLLSIAITTRRVWFFKIDREKQIIEK